MKIADWTMKCLKSVAYQNSANKRIKVWSGAILFGIANVAAMILTAFLLFGNGIFIF